MSNRRFLHIYIASLLYPSAPISSPFLRGQFHQAAEETDGAVLSESLSCNCNAWFHSWTAGCTMARMMNDIFVLPGILNEPLFSPHQLDPNSRNSFQSQTANVGVAWRHIIFCEWVIISNEILQPQTRSYCSFSSSSALPHRSVPRLLSGLDRGGGWRKWIA